MKAADVIEHIGLEDVITFGRHKGKTIETVYKEDSGYLVWLREERRTKNVQTNFFNAEVNTLLDMTIQESKSLRAKYKTWQSLGLMTQAGEGVSHVPPPPAEPTIAYEAWGVF